MTMNTTLQRTLLGQGTTSLAEALCMTGPAPRWEALRISGPTGGDLGGGLGTGAPRGPLGVLRMNADVAATCATDLQLLAEDLGCPGLAQADRARLGRIDGNAELSRLRGNEVSLQDAPTVETAAPLRAEELRELGDAYEAVELIGVGTRQMRRAAAGGMLSVVGLINYIDRLTRGAVADTLADESTTDEERAALSAEFAPRLAMLQSEKEARDERLAKSERALGPLRRAAEDAEEEEDARAILSAAESGAALSPEQVLRALDWRRRRDEEDDAMADRTLRAEAPVPAAAKRSRRR